MMNDSLQYSTLARLLAINNQVHDLENALRRESVPTTALLSQSSIEASTLSRIAEMSKTYGLRVANVFHAGDGNLHPLILYDANQPGELDKAEAFGADILRLCVEVGGVLTGEHGVGVEKRDLMGIMFTEDDLNQQQRLKCAFDSEGLLNPGKMFPTLHRCAELGRVHVHRGQVRFPDLPRF